MSDAGLRGGRRWRVCFAPTQAQPPYAEGGVSGRVKRLGEGVGSAHVRYEFAGAFAVDAAGDEHFDRAAAGVAGARDEQLHAKQSVRCDARHEDC